MNEVNVGLTDEADHAVTNLCNIMGLSATDVINQSIMINYELLKVQARGYQLTVYNPETKKSTQLDIIRH